MINIGDIDKTDYSLSIKEYGQIVTGINDVKQAIGIIITTKRGTYPLDPLFGCGLFDHIDEVASIAAPKIVRDIKEAVKKYELRAKSVNVSYLISDDSTTFTLTFTVGNNIMSQKPGMTNLTLTKNGDLTIN